MTHPIPKPSNHTKEAGMNTQEKLAAEIRRVDGNHSLGAAALAEALMPFLTTLLSEHGGGGEVGELTLGQRAVAVDLLRCCESWEPNVCVMGNVRAKDAADLLRHILTTMPAPSDGGEAWTEERLREVAKQRGWYVRDGASAPTDDGYRHPFEVCIPSRDLLRMLTTPPTSTKA